MASNIPGATIDIHNRYYKTPKRTRHDTTRHDTTRHERALTRMLCLWPKPDDDDVEVEFEIGSGY